ncbi:MAG: hypothetical protein NTW21_39545 [Verrucomicrobia bacterium]|nr:hypothetical protein [Verrucomicrobiota bacterium]
MSSKTTAWRRRKFGTPADGRGRHSNEDRAERLAFVGAVAEQLIASGSATHAGLKTYGRRVPSARESELKNGLSLAMTAGDAAETKRLLAAVGKESLRADCGDSRVVWVRPADDVWREIETAPFNADCLALAVAETIVETGHLRYRVRDARQRGTGHSDYVVRRNDGGFAPSRTAWRVIEGMTRQTASYWKTQNKREFEKAKKWLGGFLARHGGLHLVENPASGMLRDDLADVLAGKVLKIPKTGASVPLFARKLRKGAFAGGGNADG